MSRVTNCLLHFSIVENSPAIIHAVNTYFGDEPPFVSVDDRSLPRGWYGGTKMSEAPLFYGAFNHLDVQSLCNHIKTIHFRRPECVQLIVKAEQDSAFRIIHPTERKEKL